MDMFHQTNSLLQKVHLNLGRLEHTSDESQAQPMFQDVQSQLAQLSTNCTQLDQQISRLPVNQRQTARLRSEQLRYDVQCLQSSFNAIHTKLHNRWRANRERDMLLSQRYRPNETAVSFEDQELLLNDRVKNAHKGVDDLIGNAENVLSSLRSQHLNLKGVRNVLVNIGQTLGLSNTTLGLIERRVREDMTLFITGCVFFVIFMFAFYSYWTR